MADLCPEDKAKIGELVKKLAGESKEKINAQKKYEEEKKQMEARINELESKNSTFE